MGQHGPEARPHLSGLTQMGKPSAPMRGGQASRAASGGEHGGATQQKLNCLSSMYVGTFVALIPAFVFYYFARRLERCFKAVSSITFPVRGSLFPRGNVWRPNIENLILATQHKIWPPRLVRMWACMPARALLSASRLRFGGCSCPVVGSGTCLGWTSRYIEYARQENADWGGMPRKNSEIHIDVSHSRQPLVKGERLVRYEVNTVISYVSGVSYTKFQILQLGYLHNAEIQMKHAGWPVFGSTA
jgi:hypothetical protein